MLKMKLNWPKIKVRTKVRPDADKTSIGKVYHTLINNQVYLSNSPLAGSPTIERIYVAVRRSTLNSARFHSRKARPLCSEQREAFTRQPSIR